MEILIKSSYKVNKRCTRETFVCSYLSEPFIKVERLYEEFNTCSLPQEIRRGKEKTFCILF